MIDAIYKLICALAAVVAGALFVAALLVLVWFGDVFLAARLSVSSVIAALVAFTLSVFA